MGLLLHLEWMNAYSKKRCRTLFFRARSALKKALNNPGKHHRLKFQYDPSSYALNFDDGCCAANKFIADAAPPLMELPHININTNTNTTFVYVVLCLKTNSTAS